MTPLSYGLRATTGYSTKFLLEPVTHLMFVDDLKVFAPGEAALARSMKVVERITAAIGMSIGARKCATACIRKGKIDKALDIPFGSEVVKALAEGKSYKYLGVAQVFHAEAGTVREHLKTTYIERLCKIWKSRLSGRNKIHASNVWATSLFRYFFGSPLKWTKSHLRDLDRTTRKILRKFKGHYRGASIERLYLRGDRGGRGLHGLAHVYQREIVSVGAYLVTSDDPIHRAIVEHQRWRAGRGRFSLINEAEKVMAEIGMSIKLERGEVREMGTKKLACSVSHAQQIQMEEQLSLKTIHGVFMEGSKQPGRDFKSTHMWLKKGRQRAETEALVVAAQDGVIMTRAYQARVLKKSVNPMCRKCHKRPETIGHILSHCESYNWTLYKERHDQVLGVLHHHLCRNLGLRMSKPWEPIPPVLENDSVVLRWDPSIPTDRVLEHRRPDMVLIQKDRKRVVLCEMACAYDSLVEERQKEKGRKYEELAADMATQYRGHRVIIAPLVIGDMGSIGNLAESLKKLDTFSPKQLSAVLLAMQTRVLYSSTRIMKRHLAG